MATQLKLDSLTEMLIDDLMASGRFAEREEVLRHGVKLAHDKENGAGEPLDAETIALLEQRITGANANPDHSIPADQVFDDLERLCLEELEHHRHAAR